MLRFKGRDTDDVHAVSQQLTLPAASAYELTFDLKYCNTGPTGTVSFSLGNFDPHTITIPALDLLGVRSFVHTFDNSGESPVQPAGLAELVIANPALSGNDIMVDNVRIVPRFSGSLCALDPALFGEWGRDVNGGNASYDTWIFHEDGTFDVDSLRGYYSEEDPECCLTGTTYAGSWCVDTTQTPPTIILRVDSEGLYLSKSAKAEKLFEPDCGAPERAWYGRYQIEGDQLSLHVQECPDPTLESPAVYRKNGGAADNGSPLLDTCVSQNLIGQWSVSMCEKAANDIWWETWEFNNDGTFEWQQGVDDGGKGTTIGRRGTYTLNDLVLPITIDLDIERVCEVDDTVEEPLPPDNCLDSGCTTPECEQEQCTWDTCSDSDETLTGYVQMIEGDLYLRLGECKPENFASQNRYRKEGDNCVGGIKAPLKNCGGEGEGEGTVDGEAETGTEAEAGTEAEMDEGDGEGAEDHTGLVGTWGRGVCDKDLELPKHEWTFNGDGSFQEVVVAVGAGSVVRYSGSYEVNLETSPAQVDLHYTLRESYDDVVEEGEACDCGGGCFIDSCEVLDFTDLAVFEIVGNSLKLATGDCRPESTNGAPEHYLYGTYCVSEEALGVYSPAPGECSEEGEGEGTACPAGVAGDAELIEKWTVCLDPEILVGRLDWEFRADGTFSYNGIEGDAASWMSGTYTVNTGVSPHQIDLFACEVCEWQDEVFFEAENEISCLPCCSSPYGYRYGIYAIEGGELRIAESISRPSSLANEWVYQAGSIESCEGEQPQEGEGEGEGSDCKGDKCEGAEDGEPEPNDVLGAIIGFDGADGNGDGRLNFSEATNLRLDVTTFNTLDLNGDGQLTPAELLFGAGAESPRHSADTDFDGALSLAELLRSIQMYNSGGYSCAPQADSEDGYVPQPFEGKGADPGCPAHASDYAPADGVISLSELLRAIQLYNSGAYTPCESGGEDGFCL
jgi:hypothetical protein